MSAADDLFHQFYDRMAIRRWEIEDSMDWMRDYESKRQSYPAWITEDGRQVRVYELEDSHLDNLISFMRRKDPENKSHWIDLFYAEKRYRRLKRELPEMKMELLKMEIIADEL